MIDERNFQWRNFIIPLGEYRCSCSAFFKIRVEYIFIYSGYAMQILWSLMMFDVIMLQYTSELCLRTLVTWIVCKIFEYLSHFQRKDFEAWFCFSNTSETRMKKELVKYIYEHNFPWKFHQNRHMSLRYDPLSVQALDIIADVYVCRCER